MAKSGHKGENLRLSSGDNASQRSLVIQETSGDLFAPLGNLKMVEESKT